MTTPEFSNFTAGPLIPAASAWDSKSKPVEPLPQKFPQCFTKKGKLRKKRRPPLTPAPPGAKVAQ